MSTRATIKVISKGENPVWIYHHCDGYPEGVGEELKEILKNISKYVDMYDIANKIIQHQDRFGYQYELTPCQHGDEEYGYLIDTDNRILKCYSIGWDEFDWKEEKVEFEFKF